MRSCDVIFRYEYAQTYLRDSCTGNDYRCRRIELNLFGLFFSRSHSHDRRTSKMLDVQVFAERKFNFYFLRFIEICFCVRTIRLLPLLAPSTTNYQLKRDLLFKHFPRFFCECVDFFHYLLRRCSPRRRNAVAGILRCKSSSLPAHDTNLLCACVAI